MWPDAAVTSYLMEEGEKQKKNGAARPFVYAEMEKFLPAGLLSDKEWMEQQEDEEHKEQTELTRRPEEGTRCNDDKERQETPQAVAVVSSLRGIHGCGKRHGTMGLHGRLDTQTEHLEDVDRENMASSCEI